MELSSNGSTHGQLLDSDTEPADYKVQLVVVITAPLDLSDYISGTHNKCVNYIGPLSRCK
jgi:hypothetical protein